jgi:hypothetical protein
MKRLMLILAVLLVAAPAMAAVTLEVEDMGGLVAGIKYDAGGGTLPRAFALEVTADSGATIDSYSVDGCEAFDIYMGTIEITDGNITDAGTPVAPADAPDTPGQLGTSAIVLEMGSLYEAGVESAPASAGYLIKLTVSADCNVCVSGNALRGNVVLEDTNSEVPVQACGEIVEQIDCYTGPDVAEWELVGKPDSWCNPRQCHGDADADEKGDPKLGYFWVQTNDLNILSDGWKKDGKLVDDYDTNLSQYPPDDPQKRGWIAADFDHDEKGDPKLGYFRVQTQDLNILSWYWKKDAKTLGDDPAVPSDCLTATPEDPFP